MDSNASQKDKVEAKKRLEELEELEELEWL